jgi:hypothetical protein
VDMALDHSRRQLAEATAWEEVSRSADFGQPYPARPVKNHAAAPTIG